MPRVLTANEIGLGTAQAQPYGGLIDDSASPAAFGGVQAAQIGQLAQASQGLVQLGGQIALDRRNAAAWAMKSAAETETAFNGWIKEAVASGQGNLSGEFNTAWGEYKNKALENAPNAYARDVLSEEFGRLEPGFLGTIQGYEKQLADDAATSDLAGFMTSASQAVEADPTQLDSMLGRVARMTDLSALPDEQKAGIVKSARRALSNAAWRGRIARDPGAALNELGRNAPIAGLTGTDRSALIKQANEAEAEADQLQRRGERIQNQQNNQRRQDIRREGDALLASGEITPSWVKQNRAFLSDDDAEFFRQSVVAGAPEKTDPAVLVDLAERAANGEDVTDDARAAMLNGRLSLSDLNKVTRREAEKPDVKRAEARLIESLKAMMPDAPGTVGGAFNEWVAWKMEHPDASTSERDGKLQQIVRDTVKTDWAQFIRSAKPPADLIGSRETPDLAATEAALVARMKAKHGGDWTAIEADPEFQSEAVALESWRQRYEQVMANG